MWPNTHQSLLGAYYNKRIVAAFGELYSDAQMNGGG